ncbi:MAG: hypothetical protein RR459_08245 [Christensenellaceae bacterium]
MRKKLWSWICKVFLRRKTIEMEFVEEKNDEFATMIANIIAYDGTSRGQRD